METAVNISENCSDCLSDDILNIFINPHLHSITQEQFWFEGIVLLVVSSVGILSNVFIIAKLACKRDISRENIKRTEYLF